MATTLTSAIINVNIAKLKKDLEALGDIRVKEISPKDGLDDTTVVLTRGDGFTNLTLAQESSAQAVIDAHVDTQDEDIRLLGRNDFVLGNKQVGTVDIYNGGSAVWRVDASNHLLPVASAVYNIGSSLNRVAELFAVDGDFTGNLSVGGNLTVTGTLTYLNTVNLDIADNEIRLNADWVGAPTEDAGIRVERDIASDALLFWNETTDKWQAGLESDLQNIIRQVEFDTHVNNVSNPHAVTKAQVGLSDVTNDAQLKRAAGDFDSFTAKTLIVAADVFLLEDSADTLNKKKVTFVNLEASLNHANLIGVVGTTYTHTQIDAHINNVSNPHSVTKTQVGLSDVTNDAQLKRAAADFQSFSHKVAPVTADFLLIEDSADTSNKKYVTIGTLPFVPEGTLDGFPLNSTPVNLDTPVFDQANSEWDYYEYGVALKIVNTGGNIPIDETSIPDDMEYLRYDSGSGKIVWAPAPGVSSSGPIGSILPFGGTTPPMGFLFADGSAVSRVFYADLFDVIGTTFGVGDGSSTFNLPDMRQKFPLGKAVSGTGSTLGATGGNIDHTHIGGAHSHDMANHTHTGGAHTHDLSNHTHSVPAHYHGLGTGADLAIVASGSHLHKIGDFQSLVAAGVDFTVVTIGAGDTGTDTFSDSSTVSHTTADFTGRIGLVTGGVDGNAPMVSGVPSNNNTGSAGTTLTTGPSTNNTGSAGAVATDSNNPPYLALNFAIKYSDNLLAQGTSAIANDIAFSGILSQQTHSAFPNSERIWQTFAKQTTTATIDTAFTLPVPDASVLWVTVHITGRYENTGVNHNYVARALAGVRRNGGGSAVLIDLPEIAELVGENPSNYTFDIDVNGNDLRVRVTGATSETVNWAGSIEYQAVSLAV